MTDSLYDVQGQIAELWIYPVKSCAGIAVQQTRLSRHGLQWDRHWMVVDARGVLTRLMAGGMPDWKTFQDLVGTVAVFQNLSLWLLVAAVAWLLFVWKGEQR